MDGKEEAAADAVLEVGPRCFPVSRRLLAAHSSYFQAMFYGSARESSQHHITLKGVDVEAFQLLLEFAQTTRVPLSCQNVTRVLEAADFFQFQQVKRRCGAFLERELHVSNCLGMMAYARQFACPELYAAASGVAFTHLAELMCQEEGDLYQLPRDLLLELLQSDDLYVPREDLVFEAAMKWLMQDAGREEHFADLLGQVRVAFLSLAFLDALLKRSRRAEGPDAFARLLRKLDSCPPPSWRDAELAAPASRSYEILYVLGGQHEKEQQDLFLFQPKMGIWRPCAPLLRKNFTQYGVAAVGNLVFVTGGYFRGEFVWYSVDWVMIYDCCENRWLEGPAMKQSRSCHCAVGAGLHLYVLGGSTDDGVIPDVERLALADSCWESTSPMVQAVERAAASSLGSKLYVVCGRDENGDVYSGVQRLDMETDIWDVISFSPLPRYDLCATFLNGALYTIGGQAFRLDVDTDEWTLLEEECLRRKFFLGCSTVNGRIYLLGERRGSVAMAIPSVLLYDPYVDLCHVVEESVPCQLPIRGCATVRRFDV
ncbi:kelch-like protein 23 [Rhinatrema bivittatum]|uniref:kelch-like protein 23 n=1 Tax=Rhinatrema bivittatum TaxID=194408 RepID=UPI001126160F|nr:kelch-like protein 23 [Rhinatrema bivittatum]